MVVLLGVFAAVTVSLWIVVGLLAREVNAQRKDYDRLFTRTTQERKELLDRIMYLAGQPWMPPPMPEVEQAEPDPYIDDPLDLPLSSTEPVEVEASDWVLSGRV